MTLKKIRVAKEVAKCFLDRARRVEHEAKREYPVATLNGSKATGALRRISMELTRALAEMRSPE